MSAPDTTELLAHTDWLHQLARVLVGEAGADDVVQDTYEVALAKPPRRDGPLRPWLGGVARNLARMTRRGGGRREAREQAAGVLAEQDREDVPSPEELVAQGERYARSTGYPIQYQWTLLEGVNDSDEEMERLVRLLAGKYAMMNFIPFNPVEGSPFRRPSPDRLIEIVSRLRRQRIIACLRDSAGQAVEGGFCKLRARMIGG